MSIINCLDFRVSKMKWNERMHAQCLASSQYLEGNGDSRDAIAADRDVV